jgi:hypothetical protein
MYDQIEDFRDALNVDAFDPMKEMEDDWLNGLYAPTINEKTDWHSTMKNEESFVQESPDSVQIRMAYQSVPTVFNDVNASILGQREASP